MATIERILIVGAGLAGDRAAEAARKAGYEGALTIVGDEPERPYIRPPLSKDYLRGDEDVEHVYAHPAAWYDENAVELITGDAAVAIDPGASVVATASGRRLAFDRLLIATGAEPRRLDLEGAELPGVAYLRTRGDSDALRAAASEAHRIVVIGSGWIGSEVAASLRTMGREVSLVGPSAVPLERVLGSEIGHVYLGLHAAHGIDLHMDTKVSRIVGTDHVEAVELDDGQRVEADLVVAGIGVSPRVALAREAGLTIGDGIEVDATLETSVEGIFAAGDVASAWHPFYERRIRTEHWANARFQGTAAGKAMLDDDTPYERLPYFYSDQYDLSMEYRGYAIDWDAVVVRGDLATRAFIAFWLLDGIVVAAMNANISDVGKPIERLLRARTPVPPDRLSDPAIPLEELAPEA